MEKSITDTLLFRFLDKETSEEENEVILRWVSDSEDNRTEFQRLHQAHHLSKLRSLKADIDVDEAWEKLNTILPKVRTRKNLINLDILWKVAASVLLVVAGGISSLWISGYFSDLQKSAIVELKASKGEKSQAVLADGSHVWLNSQTVLKYDALNPRKITLDGEAFFEIKKDRSHPFEVITASGMKVIVTGTKFNLRSFAGESIVETTLEEGEVHIEGANNKQTAQLEPGQQAQYNIGENNMSVRNVSPELYSLWKNNELRFADISFAELVPRIERWYGVTITLDSAQKNNDRFTMTIKTESLRELLNMMQLTSKFNYEIKGEQVKINF
ncbi:anti-sigma factor [Aquipluma nitroreducens]|uniref:Anti-sigma factor n=1 Tax=Aquipluma nitroreducens TaxID=2010828 RepID=A0A5K7SDC9_9BACT|nr:FecR domain-containing protein [Aquipluma nitroreducens]BBE19485.1 anti-sigma factor [Aquipluma nitroreducens]